MYVDFWKKPEYPVRTQTNTRGKNANNTERAGGQEVESNSRPSCCEALISVQPCCPTN